MALWPDNVGRLQPTWLQQRFGFFPLKGSSCVAYCKAPALFCIRRASIIFCPKDKCLKIFDGTELEVWSHDSRRTWAHPTAVSVECAYGFLLFIHLTGY